ncbi:MAG: peptidoglycan DD-metalloendopeptidase family protein [Bacteroidales bacterium]|nr:peptidoglycan DD-metalloendopeptidase family protein [Bacteroidales bacterium]
MNLLTHRNNIFAIIVVLLLILVSSQINAQTKEELQQRKNRTEEDLRLTNQLLEKTEKSKTAGINKLLIIKKRISLRERLIREISEETQLLDIEINSKKEQIIKLERDLTKLKEEYAKMIYFAYKNRNNHDRLMFILSAEDFNQAYRRMKYFQQYTKYRKKQAGQILVTQKNLEYETEQLQDKRKEKLKLLSRKEREKANLNGEINRENQEITRLKQKESDLRKRIANNRKVMRRLENAIADLIRKEAEANKTFKTLSVEEERVYANFKKAKGRLMWPVDNGIIIQEFGEHPHPVIKGVVSKNDGIDIGTKKDSQVKAIFEGQVKKVIAVPGANMAVIIRHGHYLSLYSNIINVRVKPGEIVRTGHYIGDVYYKELENEGAVLHLRIYEETKVLNPKIWLH